MSMSSVECFCFEISKSFLFSHSCQQKLRDTREGKSLFKPNWKSLIGVGFLDFLKFTPRLENIRASFPPTFWLPRQSDKLGDFWKFWATFNSNTWLHFTIDLTKVKSLFNLKITATQGTTMRLVSYINNQALWSVANL